MSNLVHQFKDLSLSVNDYNTTNFSYNYSAIANDCLIDYVSDDVWIDLLTKFSNVKDLLSIRQTCHYCHNLTNPQSIPMNTYWKHQCNILCNNIDQDYTTNHWYQFYRELCKLFITCNYVSERDHLSYSRFIKKAINLAKYNTCNNGYLTLCQREDIAKGVPLLYQACQYDCVNILDMFLFSIQHNASQIASNNMKNNYIYYNHSYYTGNSKNRYNNDDKDSHNSHYNPNYFDINSLISQLTPKLDHSLTKTQKTQKTRKQRQKSVCPTAHTTTKTSDDTLLYVACYYNSENIVRYLLSFQDICLSVRSDRYQSTPLMIAAKQGHRNIIQMFLTHPKITKYDLNCKNKQENTALNLAFDSNDSKIAAILINNGAKCADYGRELLLAASRQRWDMVRIILNYNYNCIFASDHSGMTAFCWAALNGDSQNLLFIYQFLISNMNKHRFSLKMVDNYINKCETKHCRTAYMLACKSGSKSTIRALVNVCKVNVKAKDKYYYRGSHYFQASARDQEGQQFKRWLYSVEHM